MIKAHHVAWASVIVLIMVVKETEPQYRYVLGQNIRKNIIYI